MKKWIKALLPGLLLALLLAGCFGIGGSFRTSDTEEAEAVSDEAAPAADAGAPEEALDEEAAEEADGGEHTYLNLSFSFDGEVVNEDMSEDNLPAVTLMLDGRRIGTFSAFEAEEAETIKLLGFGDMADTVVAALDLVGEPERTSPSIGGFTANKIALTYEGNDGPQDLILTGFSDGTYYYCIFWNFHNESSMEEVAPIASAVEESITQLS